MPEERQTSVDAFDFFVAGITFQAQDIIVTWPVGHSSEWFALWLAGAATSLGAKQQQKEAAAEGHRERTSAAYSLVPDRSEDPRAFQAGNRLGKQLDEIRPCCQWTLLAKRAALLRCPVSIAQHVGT